MNRSVGTIFVVIIFALIFFFGNKIRLPNKKLHRSVLSFAAGIAVAYIFVHVLPELQIAKKIFLYENIRLPVVFSEHIVYLMTMLGFILFYGLERMGSWSLVKSNRLFLLQIGGYAAYVVLVSYLMIRNIETGIISVSLYGVAMSFHFLALDFHFCDEYGQLYKNIGKNILTAAVIIGCGIGLLTKLHKILVILLLGLLSGAVIMNSMIMELPQGKDGKFFPFLFGGISYVALLFSIG